MRHAALFLLALAALPVMAQDDVESYPYPNMKSVLICRRCPSPWRGRASG